LQQQFPAVLAWGQANTQEGGDQQLTAHVKRRGWTQSTTRPGPKGWSSPTGDTSARNGRSDDHVKTGLLKASTTTYLIGILGITKETAAAAETTSL
jgi:hypothetical protein